MTDILMPRLSDTMEEGVISRWNVKVGDEVTKGDILGEIETDKATMDFEAYDTGVVSSLLVEEGATVAIGERVAVLGEDAATAATPATAMSRKKARNPKTRASRLPVRNPVVTRSQATKRRPALIPATRNPTPTRRPATAKSQRIRPVRPKIRRHRCADLAVGAEDGREARYRHREDRGDGPARQDHPRRRRKGDLRWRCARRRRPG
jgi:pyruvate dehydrogenase E2 component (dihydrolipoamide acetyltransferase)